MDTITTNKCTFFGHKEIEITESLKNRLYDKIESLIISGFGEFYFGGLSDFDDLCYFTVSTLKEKYPWIRRIFCLYDPRHEREAKRPSWLKERNFEHVEYLSLSFDWWYQRIYFRNVEMINLCDYVIFFVREDADKRSGAKKALDYASKIKKRYTNLASKDY